MERENRGRRERVREKAIVVIMIPSSLEGWAPYVEGGLWEIYSLACGDQSWLTEHLETHTHTQASISNDWFLSYPFFCLTLWHNEVHHVQPPSVSTENLSNCWITVISSEAGTLDFFNFEVVTLALKRLTPRGRKRYGRQRCVYCNELAFSEPVQTLRCQSTRLCACKTERRARQERGGWGCF